MKRKTFEKLMMADTGKDARTIRNLSSKAISLYGSYEAAYFAYLHDNHCTTPLTRSMTAKIVTEYLYGVRCHATCIVRRMIYENSIDI